MKPTKLKINVYSAIVVAVCFIIFFLGLYVYSTGKLQELLLYENMENNTAAVPASASPLMPMPRELPPPIATSSAVSSQCPNLLVKKNNKYYLFNTLKPTLEGSNPLVFNDLEEYTKYHAGEKARGSICPIVYLQQENNAQGKDVYRSQSNPAGGAATISQFPALHQLPTNRPVVPYTDASRDNPPYNQGHYQGFDPSDQYIGKYTILDQIHDSTQYLGENGKSPNPADTNWGGVLYTQEQIDRGVYEENNVRILTA